MWTDEVAEQHQSLLLLHLNTSNDNIEVSFDKLSTKYSSALVATNLINEKLRAQIEFTNSTNIAFQTLRNAIDNNRVTSVNSPFLYRDVRIQSCNTESNNI